MVVIWCPDAPDEYLNTSLQLIYMMHTISQLFCISMRTHGSGYSRVPMTKEFKTSAIHIKLDISVYDRINGLVIVTLNLMLGFKTNTYHIIFVLVCDSGWAVYFQNICNKSRKYALLKTSQNIYTKISCSPMTGMKMYTI